jgi:hypothetical protein
LERNREETSIDQSDDGNFCSPFKGSPPQASLGTILPVDGGGHRKGIGQEYDDAGECEAGNRQKSWKIMKLQNYIVQIPAIYPHSFRTSERTKAPIQISSSLVRLTPGAPHCRMG